MVYLHGADVLLLLHAQEDLRILPVIRTTTKMTPEMLALGDQAAFERVVAVLHKPFEVTDLLEQVQRALAQP